MSIYAIGDVQGCYTELQQLLEKIPFDATKDQLWFVGDLVNRGAHSLEVLRLVKSFGDRAITVLGNHDLHLLAVAAGHAKLHRSDTLDEILAAPDRDELLHWLRQRPLLHCDGNYVLVHAGLLPQWTVAQAVDCAHEVENALRSENFADFFAHMYGNSPLSWRDDLTGYKRLRVIVNAFTRMRICTPQGEMEFKFKAELEKMPAGYVPWYEVPNRQSLEATVLFGHWSALGLKLDNQVIALDTGCLWGGCLSALRLEDRQLFQVPCAVSAPKQW
jgi:bis(5'-nucleosyl)-tetraphosphatase (symmetrical)